MTKSSLTEQLGRLGRVQGVDRVSSGTRVSVVIKLRNNDRICDSIRATHALARRGLSLLKAKRVIEKALIDGRVVVILPKVDDIGVLGEELSEAGFLVVTRRRPIDVGTLRSKLGLSQKQFGERFAIPTDTLQNWEQGRTKPDSVHMAYLRSIERLAGAIEAAQDDEL